MADYTTITDAQVDPEAPITSELMSALRDNPIAIAEGATGAPRIEDAALDTTVTSAGTDWVAARIAGVAVGSIGTYAWATSNADTTAREAGSTVTGSQYAYAGGFNNNDSITLQGTSSGVLSGTWRVMGRFNNSTSNSTRGYSLLLRIA